MCEKETKPQLYIPGVFPNNLVREVQEKGEKDLWRNLLTNYPLSFPREYPKEVNKIQEDSKQKQKPKSFLISNILGEENN